jgi:glycosyltransferase involved in cell wall biosynthesis
MPLLRELAEAHRVRFRIVGAGHAASAYAFPGMEMIEWSEAGEVACVQQMQIGIMPLPDEPWAQGKSGYKLIQYMACGIPVVASPVGVNASIVTPGENGFLARDLNEWRNALTALIEQPELRLRMGEAGRARAVQAFSVSAHAHRFADLLRGAASASMDMNIQ